MAMELTHVRFALDLLGRCNVSDGGVYLSGAIYPDSRYVTGIDRDVTHTGTSPHNPFDEESDFRKGWATHVLYDELSVQMAVRLSPWPGMAIRQGDELWRYITAVKIVEDIQSYDVLGEASQSILGASYSEAPNGESLEKLEEYCELQRQLYEVKPTIQSYKKLFEGFGVSKVLLDDIVKYAEEILVNDNSLAAIRGIYTDVLDRVSVSY